MSLVQWALLLIALGGLTLIFTKVSGRVTSALT